MVPTAVEFSSTVKVESLVMLRACPAVTVKLGPVAVCPPTSTFTGPLVAPEGTVVTSCVVEALVSVASVPLKVTVLLAVVELKLVPVMVT